MKKFDAAREVIQRNDRHFPPTTVALKVALKPQALFSRSFSVSKCVSDGFTISGAKGREAATAQGAMLPSSGP